MAAPVGTSNRHDIAETTFELPPRRFRHHFGVLTVLAIFAVAPVVVIWLYVPNEGDGPLLGWLLNGCVTRCWCCVGPVRGVPPRRRTRCSR